MLLLAYGKGVHYDEKTIEQNCALPAQEVPYLLGIRLWKVGGQSEKIQRQIQVLLKALMDYRRKEMTDANEQNAQIMD